MWKTLSHGELKIALIFCHWKYVSVWLVNGSWQAEDPEKRGRVWIVLCSSSYFFGGLFILLMLLCTSFIYCITCIVADHPKITTKTIKQEHPTKNNEVSVQGGQQMSILQFGCRLVITGSVLRLPAKPSSRGWIQIWAWRRSSGRDTKLCSTAKQILHFKQELPNSCNVDKKFGLTWTKWHKAEFWFQVWQWRKEHSAFHLKS